MILGFWLDFLSAGRFGWWVLIEAGVGGLIYFIDGYGIVTCFHLLLTAD